MCQSASERVLVLSWQLCFAAPGRVQLFHMLASRPVVLQLAQVLLWPPRQHIIPTLPHKDIREVSSSVPGGQPSTPTPHRTLWPLSCGNSGFVQKADPWCPLGRLSTDQSKTPPYASPSPLQSHTLRLYPRVRELIAFSARGERWFHWAFKREVPGCHAC